MAIPNIEKKDIYAALKYIDEKGVLPGYKSKIYDLSFEGKTYPPKYVIAVARHLKDKVAIDASDFNSIEARKYFTGNGFEIAIRNKNGTIIQAWWNAHKNDLKIKEILEKTDFIYQEQQKALDDWLNADVSFQGLKLVATIPNPTDHKDEEFDSLCGSLTEMERDALKRLILTFQKNKPISLDNYGRKVPLARSLARYRLKEPVGPATQRVFDYCNDSIHLIPLSKEKMAKACSKLNVDDADESLLRLFEELSLDNAICVNAKNQTKLYCEILWNALGLDEKKDSTDIGDGFMKEISHYAEFLKKNRNIILHGAPGTGKTYLAKEIARAMGCGEDEIGFVQFHQSYDYTDFVEGLRPVQKGASDIGFERRDGIFKEFCAKAITNIEDSVKTVEQVGKEKTAENEIDLFLSNAIDKKTEFRTITGNKFYVNSASGKVIVVSIPENEKMNTLPLQRSELMEMLNCGKEINNGNDILDLFHRKWRNQHDSYLLILYKEIRKNKAPVVTAPVVVVTKKKNYVFIIDEINRGEMSKIFGELFFSIDPGYRGQKGRIRTQYANLQDKQNEFDKALNVADSNSFGNFFVPENVYIIGTMNDIDRSVESMDFAMRRRFAFKEVKADERIDMLRDEKNGVAEYAERAIRCMKSLNKAIEETEGLSSAYDIGPAYFLKLKNYEGDFRNLWDYHIEGVVRDYLRGIDDDEKKFEKLKDAYFAEVEN